VSLTPRTLCRIRVVPGLALALLALLLTACPPPVQALPDPAITAPILIEGGLVEGRLVRATGLHLALPNQNGFFRAQQQPGASVLLTLHPGRTLDKAQVAGIVHLVASSVPEMNPKAVSVVDDAGNLLSAADQAQDSEIRRLQYVQQIEQLYTRRILDMIEPLVGVGNVRAQVSAELDFSQVESTSEQHRPNQGTEPSAVRSQQVVEDGRPGQAQPAGVPGATTNQPPATGTAPINAPAAPLGVAGSTDSAGNVRRESVTNFEVDRTVRVVREATGTIRRLSAAVVVNHRSTTDPRNGKVSSVAIPPEQIEQMTALVRETIGFNSERGDSVNLVNAPFSEVKPVEAETPAWWALPDNQALLRDMALPAGMVLLGLLIFMGMVRPGLKLMKTPATPPAPAPEAPQLSTVLDETPERPALPVPEPDPVVTPDKRLEQARRLALENPVAVANIVKGWVNGEAPA